MISIVIATIRSALTQPNEVHKATFARTAWNSRYLTVGATDLASPSSAVVDTAIATQMIRYNRNINGGAHTNGAFFGGASIALAVASYSGNIRSDSRLLQQIRHILTPGNEPTSNGGYAAQHGRHATGMFVIAKNTPRIRNQLSRAEKTGIGLIMKATFIASAFTTIRSQAADERPLVSFGLITDAQYADADPEGERHYRESIPKLRAAADATKEPVIVRGHPCVRAYLCGHNHAGAEAVDNGIPRITFKSLLHEPEITSYAVLRLFPDRLVIEGRGREKSRAIPLPA